MWQKMKALREERGQYLADMKAILIEADAEEKRGLTEEETTKFNDLHAKAEQRLVTISQYERAQALEAELAAKGEQRAGRDDINTPEQQADSRAAEVRSQFAAYLRTGSLAPAETRALTVSGAGVIGDRAYYNQLVTTLKTFAGVREAGATILPTSDGNDLTVPRADDTSNTGQIVGEGATDNTDADPTLSNITLKSYKFDSKWIKVSLEMLQDAAFPIEQYINGIAGERIGRAFNAFATTGTGVGQPKGFLTAGTLGKAVFAVVDAGSV